MRLFCTVKSEGPLNSNAGKSEEATENEGKHPNSLTGLGGNDSSSSSSGKPKGNSAQNVVKARSTLSKPTTLNLGLAHKKSSSSFSTLHNQSTLHLNSNKKCGSLLNNPSTAFQRMLHQSNLELDLDKIFCCLIGVVVIALLGLLATVGVYSFLYDGALGLGGNDFNREVFYRDDDEMGRSQGFRNPKYEMNKERVRDMTRGLDRMIREEAAYVDRRKKASVSVEEGRR